MNNFKTIRMSLIAIGVMASFAAAPAVLSQSTDSSASVGAAITDTGITAQVKSKIAADSRLKGSNVSVETNNGVVTLTGSAASSKAKAAAEELAGNVSNVKSVNDQLTAPSAVADLGAKTKHVANETGEAISDTYITTKIKTEFGTDKKTKGSNVDVTTNDGIVALSGTVV